MVEEREREVYVCVCVCVKERDLICWSCLLGGGGGGDRGGGISRFSWDGFDDTFNWKKKKKKKEMNVTRIIFEKTKQKTKRIILTTLNNGQLVLFDLADFHH